MGKWQFSGGNTILVVALQGNGGRMAYSYDGITYHEGAVLSPTFDGYAAVCTASGIWILGGRDTAGNLLGLYRSQNGIDWTSLPAVSTGLAMDSTFFNCAAFFNNVYLIGTMNSASGLKICRSTTDFVTYIDPTNGSFGFAQVPQGALCGMASNGSRLVICGEDDINTSRINYSPDGFTPFACTMPAISNGVKRGICYSPERNLFVCGGSSTGKNIWNSSDGMTFVEASGAMPFPIYTMNDVCWARNLGLFCAVFDHNSIAYSSDGNNWTGIAGPFFLPTDGIRRICYSNSLGLFLIGCDRAGQIATSPDAINWTVRTPVWSGGATGSYGVGCTYGG